MKKHNILTLLIVLSVATTTIIAQDNTEAQIDQNEVIELSDTVSNNEKNDFLNEQKIDKELEKNSKSVSEVDEKEYNNEANDEVLLNEDSENTDSEKDLVEEDSENIESEEDSENIESEEDSENDEIEESMTIEKEDNSSSSTQFPKEDITNSDKRENLNQTKSNETSKNFSRFPGEKRAEGTLYSESNLFKHVARNSSVEYETDQYSDKLIVPTMLFINNDYWENFTEYVPEEYYRGLFVMVRLEQNNQKVTEPIKSKYYEHGTVQANATEYVKFDDIQFENLNAGEKYNVKFELYNSDGQKLGISHIADASKNLYRDNEESGYGTSTLIDVFIDAIDITTMKSNTLITSEDSTPEINRKDYKVSKYVEGEGRKISFEITSKFINEETYGIKRWYENGDYKEEVVYRYLGNVNKLSDIGLLNEVNWAKYDPKHPKYIPEFMDLSHNEKLILIYQPIEDTVLEIEKNDDKMRFNDYELSEDDKILKLDQSSQFESVRFKSFNYKGGNESFSNMWTINIKLNPFRQDGEDKKFDNFIMKTGTQLNRYIKKWSPDGPIEELDHSFDEFIDLEIVSNGEYFPVEKNPLNLHDMATGLKIYEFRFDTSTTEIHIPGGSITKSKPLKSELIWQMEATPL